MALKVKYPLGIPFTLTEVYRPKGQPGVYIKNAVRLAALDPVDHPCPAHDHSTAPQQLALDPVPGCTISLPTILPLLLPKPSP